MRRFITYIYEYEQGNRGRNTGFIRTDLRENSCRMELQIRGFDRFKGKCPVYLTVYENGLQAIPVTELCSRRVWEPAALPVKIIGSETVVLTCIRHRP